LIAALVLGSSIDHPAILVLLTFPVTLLTLGLFLFVINALMLWLAATIVPGFRSTVLGSLSGFDSDQHCELDFFSNPPWEIFPRVRAEHLR